MIYDNIFKTAKMQKAALKASMRDILLDVASAKYRWDGLPDYIRPEFLELYLLTTGKAAIIKAEALRSKYNGAYIPDDWEYLLTLVDRGGRPDIYGNGSQPIFTTLNGTSAQLGIAVNNVVYDGYDEPIAVICQANNTETPDATYQIASQMLTESLTSLIQNIIHSRYSPVITVSDSNIKKAVEDAMASIIEGRSVVITSSNLLNEIETGIKACDTVPFNDVEKQQYIQYICKAVDDVCRWFLTIHGQTIQGNGKLAQQTVDEVNGSTSASFILPELGWRWRDKFCDDLKLIGIDASVTYNKPWTVEVEKYTEDVEEPIEEEVQPEKEPAEEEAPAEEEPEKEESNE